MADQGVNKPIERELVDLAHRVTRLETRERPAAGAVSWATAILENVAYLTGGGSQALMRLSSVSLEHSGGYSLVQHPTHTGDTGKVHGIAIPAAGYYLRIFEIRASITMDSTFTELFLKTEIEGNDLVQDRRLAYQGAATTQVPDWRVAHASVDWHDANDPVFAWLLSEETPSSVVFSAVEPNQPSRLSVRRWDA